MSLVSPKQSVDLQQPWQEIDVLDLLVAIVERGNVLVGGLGLGAVLGLGLSLLLPRYYEARTSILPPQTRDSAATLLAGQLTALTGMSARDFGLKNSNDLYVALLRSETVADNLIESARLREAYGLSQLTETRKRLATLTNIAAGKDGLIVIQVQDRNPDRAAQLANGYVDQLRQLNQRIAITEASQRRLFFEQQLTAAQHDLATAEDAFGVTERQTGVVELGAHAKALVEQIATVRAKLAAKQVEIDSMRSYATDRNPVLKRTQSEAEALRTELVRLEHGSGEGVSGSTGTLSSSAVEYGRRLRELKSREAIFELLTKQLEAARLDEAKEGTVVQVVDHAAVPVKPAWPPKTFLVIASTLFGGLAAAGWAVLKASFQRAAQDPRRLAKLNQLKTILSRT